MRNLTGQSLVPGTAAGPVLFADLGLSFMGGVDPASGTVTDVHHPLLGQNVGGTILAIPSGRGSCSGSLILFQLLLNGHAPQALVFQHSETILTLGSLIAEELFGKGIPVVRLAAEDFAAMALAPFARITDGAVTLSGAPEATGASARVRLPELDLAGFALSPADRRMLAGEDGAAAQLALRIIIRAAQLEGADSLVDVVMGHIDGCFYQGPASLQFTQALLERGARVRVPTSMNAICVDRQQWRDLGVAAALGLPSDELAEAYVAMGVKPTYTCAPYLLEPKPAFGQQIAWAESNAVMYANSVLGARTMKYPDYLDILVALTGRAPHADCHSTEGRRAAVRIDVPRPQAPDDAYYAMLGYHVGKIATNSIPLVGGLAGLAITTDHLKSFGAAFATTSAAPMFHILGVTPEATNETAAAGPHGCRDRILVTAADLVATWRELNTAPSPAVDLIALGNPHFSLTEIADLAGLCAGRRKAGATAMLITCGREVFAAATLAGHTAVIQAFGGRFLNDTCWCFIGEPVVPAAVSAIATNSGKYAHYGPAAVRKGFHFGSLARCVDAAVTGEMDTTLPPWLAAAT